MKTLQWYEHRDLLRIQRKSDKNKLFYEYSKWKRKILGKTHITKVSKEYMFVFLVVVDRNEKIEVRECVTYNPRMGDTDG